MIIDVRKNILIVGLGLIGGSYAEALKRYGFRVTAITRSQRSIDYALGRGMIDDGAAFVREDLVSEADIVVFALYPHVFIEWIEKNQHLFKPGALITDVTGVKGSVVYKVQEILRPDCEFIAAHPMAGREVYGVENATARIFNAVREKPEKEPQIKSFMSYYLPTTLKLLRSYADFEQSGADGENIRAAKAEIERILDTLVDGFKKQLDKLYESDAMDISSDIDVLESMLRRDGLAGDGSAFQKKG